MEGNASMTKKQLLKESEKMLKDIEQAMDNDSEITIDGNGYNPCEISGAARWYANLIRRFMETENVGKGLSPK